MTEIVRLTPEQRERVIIDAAVTASETHGLCGWTRRVLAEACSVNTSPQLTKHYFPNLEDLRKRVLLHPNCTDDMRAQARAMGISYR